MTRFPFPDALAVTLLLVAFPLQAEPEKAFQKEILQLLVEGYPFTEGPTWDGEKHILFTSPRTNEVIRFSPTDKTHSTFYEGENPVSALFHRDGRLVATQGALKRVIEIEGPEEFVSLADSFEGAAFNKPNDLWLSPTGHLYFTDPNYGSPMSPDGEFAYHVDPEGNVARIDARFDRPNGIVGSEDGKLLYVTDAAGSKTYRFEIDESGTPGKPTLFADIGGDGMTLDHAGNLYLAVPRQKALVVLSPAGKEIARIAEFGCTNVCFGPNGKTLYITAKPGLWALEVY